LSSNECEINNPVENDLQLIHWGNSTGLIILVSFSCKDLCHEHADTDDDYHDYLEPSIVGGLSGTIAKEQDHQEG
jgi:hypothetical protein